MNQSQNQQGPHSDSFSILAPYEKTRPGFELIRKDVCEVDLDCGGFRNAGEGYFEVCLWDIWHWATGEKEGKPRSDPALNDPEKQAINKMQIALGELSEEDRLIRIQSACLTRCYYTFPKNIDLVIDGIATGKPNVSAHISCEPPWNHSILPLLRRRYKYQDGTRYHSRDRQSLVRAYMTILDSYLVGGHLSELREVLPDNPELAEKVYNWLGNPSPAKRLQVTRLRNALTMWSLPSQFGEAFDYFNQIDKILSASRQTDTQESDELTALIRRLNDAGLCHQFFFRRLDHLIAYVGAGKRCELPGRGEGRKFVIDTLVNYVHTLGSWLAGRTIDQAADIWPPCKQTVCAIYVALGEPSLRKRWLVACLWKNLQEIQSWVGRGLLDEEPDRFAIHGEALTVEGKKKTSQQNRGKDVS